MSWKAEVEGAANGLRFATEREATEYGNDLWRRWLGCPEHPVSVECDDPITHTWNDTAVNKLGNIKTGDSHTPADRVQL